MVFIAMLGGCNSCEKIEDQERKIERLQNKIEEQSKCIEKMDKKIDQLLEANEHK